MLATGGPVPYTIIDGMKCYEQTNLIPQELTYFVMGIILLTVVSVIYFVSKEWRLLRRFNN